MTAPELSLKSPSPLPPRWASLSPPAPSCSHPLHLIPMPRSSNTKPHGAFPIVSSSPHRHVFTCGHRLFTISWHPFPVQLLRPKAVPGNFPALVLRPHSSTLFLPRRAQFSRRVPTPLYVHTSEHLRSLPPPFLFPESVFPQ